MSESTQVVVDGDTASGFESVREAFERNFAEHGDRGASVAVYVDGEKKVDLWGGVADVVSGRPWTEDTLALVYSATKGATSVVCNLLGQRNELDLDAAVSEYWPEFSAKGKQSLTVRQLLSHQAGLPVIDSNLSREELLAGTPVAEVLARQAPAWEPGAAHGYHALTFGWLTNEVVRRATGHTLGQVFASEVAQPLGLDFWIGLPESEEPRVAPLIDMPPPDPSALDSITDPEVKAAVLRLVAAMGDQSSMLWRALMSNGALPTPSAEHWNSRDIHAVEQPAANGITNARSLARMYAACVSEVDGFRLLDKDTVETAVQEQTKGGPDLVFGAPTRFGTGFMLPSASFTALSEGSFGHTGAGGALGFADVDRRVGFGYVQNQLGGGPLGDPRTLGLIDAVQVSLGR